MVRVGEAWKLTGIPRSLEGETRQVEGGIVMQPALAGLSICGGGSERSPGMKQLVEQLQKIDQAAPKPDAARSDIAAYNAQRAQLLGQLAEAAGTAPERETWQRQQIDQIAAAVQLDAFPDGIQVLTAIE